MFKNYFKIASRSLWKNKTFSVINIVGLAIGITCCLLIAAFLYDELSYDKYSEHAKDLYRVELNVADNGNASHYSLIDVGVGEGLKAAFPEIVSFTRVVKSGNFFFKYGNNQFKENDFAIADSNFLEMFSIPLLQGNTATALKEPNSIVISKAYAKKYFGTEDALGKSITGVKTGRLLKVTGIFDKIPSNTHFSFDMILSSNGWGNQHTWSNIGYYTYLQLKPGTNPKMLEAKFPQVLGANTNTILLLVSKEYVYIVLIAFVVAVPLTWFAMNQWLQDFAYRINISVWIFLAAGASALMLALLTVSFQAIKAAVANPVKSLRTE